MVIFDFDILKILINSHATVLCKILECVFFLKFESIHFIDRCHGEKGNVVYELSRDKNLLSSSPLKSSMFQFIRSNDGVITEKMSEKLSNVCMQKCFLETEADQIKLKAYNGSLGDLLAEE